MIGNLMRHRRHHTTAPYAHLADQHLVDIEEKVGSIIGWTMWHGAGSASLENTQYQSKTRELF